MNVILWTAASAIALLIAVVAVLAARRDRPTDKPDLGSISGTWLNEHNTGRDGKS